MRWILALAFFLVPVATQQATAQQSTPHRVMAIAPPIPMGPGDLVQISIFDSPDLSGNFRVDELGDISLPLIGTIHAQGKTATVAAREIEQRYIAADVLTPSAAHANVFIAEYATQGIVVNGEVRNPGLYPALGVRMLNDLITAAGGIQPQASSDVVITHRNDPQHPETVVYDPMARKPVVAEIQVFPGDSIMVPRAGVVYVLGAVTKPGEYVMNGRDQLTVEKAMAVAGGMSRAPNLRHVHLVRTVEEGRKEDVLLNVNEILHAKAPDIVMKDGDILYIPVSGKTLAAQQAIATALGVGTAIAIYRLGLQ